MAAILAAPPGRARLHKPLKYDTNRFIDLYPKTARVARLRGAPASPCPPGRSSPLYNDPKSKSTTLSAFVAHAQPISWGDRETMLLDEWFRWPPDVFALVSLLLGSSGAYRRAVAPAKGEWPERGWPKTAQEVAEEWKSWVASGAEGDLPPRIGKYKTKLEKLRDVPVDDLYDPEGPEPWELCATLLDLLGIADETMRGVGIVFAPRTTFELVRDQPRVDKEIAFFHLQANFLLTLRGSLSRMPKYLGIVLPKARTPQVGLTLRSFSNNLTFHQTEVDVAWRTFPWFNSDENTVNLMIVPWPFKVRGNFFRPIPHPKAHSHMGSNRYFHYEPDSEDGLDVPGLVQALREASDEVRRVHMLVFPEMALRPNELTDLKGALEELPPLQIPMIVTGVSAPYSNGDGSEEPGDDGEPTVFDHQTDRNFRAGDHAAGYNRVVLSLYFAGKWHDVVQDKHHRWKLDGSQIEQYRLGGILSGTREWWEMIQVNRRRLSVLAANSWLTICPLICEDLARLDPVSELVRGVGPTLLTALLLDGPQLKNRWSARYASVFADDPGSSVLTLTSFGMSRRSTIPGGVSDEELKKARESAPVIGLWKDQQNWHEIRIKEENPIKILTIGAVWKSETAFDGRVDAESSAAFVYQGMFDQKLGSGEAAESLPPKKAEAKKTEAEKTKRYAKDADAKQRKHTVLDMCELTLFTFFADALVESTTVDGVERLSSWFQRAVGRAGTTVPEGCSDLQSEILDWLVHSIATRDLVPREVPTPYLILTIERATRLITGTLKEFPGDPTETPPIAYWVSLKERAVGDIDEVIGKMAEDDGAYEKELEAIADDQWKNVKEGSIVELDLVEIGRLHLMAPLTMLWAIHSRLTTRRRYGVLSYGGASLIQEIERIVDDPDRHRRFREWKLRLEPDETELAVG